MPVQTEVRPDLLTGEELLEKSDVGPSELVEGRIVPMSYTNRKHARIVLLLGYELESFVREQSVAGKVFVGDAGLYTERDPDTVRGVDVAFVSEERLAENTSGNLLDVGPELVVEVISPSNSWEGVRRKIGEYFAIGTERVWIVEPANRSVLIFSAPDTMRALRGNDRLEGKGALDGFALPVASLFEA
jgi:Uma2 family endonuclease